MEFLYEMHSHIKEVSTCSGSYARDLIEYYKNLDYAGIVLTDHMNRSTFKNAGLDDAPWEEKAEHYLSGFRALQRENNERFILLQGMEISFYSSPNDYLVYGVTEDFIKNNGDLMAMKPKQFAKLARENGLIFLQAHPFRRGMEIENWEILDGYEIFNGNPRHNSCNDIAELWAKKHQKAILTSGSDFHEKEDAGSGGIYFQTLIRTNEELLRELRSGNYRLKNPGK